ncbi:MAG: polymerase [Patescibacteria group bacterium]|nr:polymerase [Patescibacteria group bacterium]
MKKRLVLLDSHALLHRAYHAMVGFSTYDGRPTGALFGFIKMVLKIKDELKPDYVVACFDRKEATFRHEVYENYKAQRAKSDEELVSQIKLAPKICEALNIPVYSLAGFEADDLLGTIVEELTKENFKVRGEDLEIFIASGDMDTMQLIDKENHVKVYTLKKGIGETVVYKYEDVEKRFNFSPEQIPDYKGLRGDASDNIIGIKGIGEKTATTLINLFGPIEKMYEILHTNKEKFIDICKKDKANKITDRIINLIIEGEEEAIFSKTLATIRKDAPINFSLPEKEWLKDFNEAEFLKICNEFEFRSFRNVFSQKPLINTSSKSNSKKNDFNESDLNIGGLDLNEQEESENKKNNPLFSGEGEDFLELKVMLNLLNSEITNPEIDQILDFTKVDSLNEAREVLEDRLKKENLTNLFELVEKPIIEILREMKKNGILLDKEILKQQSENLHAKVRELEKEIFAHAKEEFNISSPKQLGVILYEKLKLGEKIKKTAGGSLSTNAGELEKLKDSHEIINLVLEYRELTKLLSTYVDTLGNFVKEDGRIHSDFIQTGTTTGRFSSENPNLQNLPARSGEGILVRKAFIAAKNKKLFSLDYSQIDLRSAAILSKDENLIDIFKNGADVHTGVAARVFKVSEDKVDSDMRRKAKVINFGILYGMGVNALKDSMKVDRKEAQEFYDEYKKTFSTLNDYLEKVKEDARKNGFTETLLGRRRQIPLLKSKLPFLRAQGERVAINAPIQGTTADILKLAMIDIDKYIKENNLSEKVKILLQIHDELILEVDEECVDKEKNVLKNILENVLEKRLNDKKWKDLFITNTAIEEVFIKSDLKIGDNLYELK